MPSANVPWEAGCRPADPAISASFGAYSGSGYNPIRGGTGEVGTINPGLSTPVTPGPQPAQVRFFVGSDSNLYGLDNITGLTFKVASGAGPVQPPIYSPTAEGLHEINEPKPAYQGTYLGQKSPLGQWYWEGTGLSTDDWQQI